MTRQWITILVVIAILPAPCGGAPADSEVGFFYFDPDTRLHDFELLKIRFQEFLPDAYSFQPFLRMDDLLEELPARRPQFIILTAERTGELASGNTAVPLLVPESGGSNAYRKKLLMRREAKGIQLVAGTRKIDMGEECRDWSWVLVAKDLDALLAVALGQVDAAIVDPGSIDLLRSINPSALGKLAVGDDTKPIYHSPLCFIRELASEGEVDAVRRRFLSMHEQPGGRELLMLLGFDRWTDPPNEMIGGSR